MAGLTMRGCRSWFLSAERHMKEGLCQKEMGVSESLTKPVPGASQCTWHWTWPWLSLAWPTICCTFCPLSRQLDRFALFWIRWFALQQSADLPWSGSLFTLLHFIGQQAKGHALAGALTSICHSRPRCALWDSDKMSRGSAAKRCDRSLFLGICVLYFKCWRPYFTQIGNTIVVN